MLCYQDKDKNRVLQTSLQQKSSVKHCIKLFAVITIVCTVVINQTSISFAQAKETAANSKITQHEPEMMATPEQVIPVEIVKEKMSKWEWILLGTLAVGAIAAAGAAGGGGGGGGGEPAAQQPAGDQNEGNVEVNW